MTTTETSVSYEVTQRIREAIHAGTYPPGHRLVERALSAQLGVSHIPVREALTRLTQEGLVVRAPRRGARVAELSPAVLEEISSLRTLLECFVAERVQQRWTAEAAAELGELVRQMHAAAAEADVARVAALDEAFHEALWRLADHALLLEVVSQLRNRITQFVRVAARRLDAAELLAHAASHAALVADLASRDAERAREGMREHIAQATARIDGSLGAA